MHASLSNSMTGGNQWQCWLHFGKDKSQWSEITAEIRRLHWLVDGIRCLRIAKGTSFWVSEVKKVQQAIKMAQRSDLMNQPKESGQAWVERLERELKASCAQTLQTHMNV